MICLVNGPNGARRLIRAKSHNAAVKHVVADAYTSKAVGAEELVDLLQDGLKVEDATVETETSDDSAEDTAGGIAYAGEAPQEAAVNG